MGNIIKAKNSSQNKTIVHLELTQEEAQKLKGHSKKIHLFSEKLCIHDIQLIERGKENSTKYAIIPSMLRKRREFKPSRIQYQKIETDSKTFFIIVTENRRPQE